MTVDNEMDDSLSCSYTCWFNNYDRSKSYNDTLVKITSFDTLDKFWNIYNSLSFPDELNIHADCLIFKTGIKPIWEDPANIAGGKWILRVKKGLASHAWQQLIVAMLQDEFAVGDDRICGVAVSVRGQEDILSVWNMRATDSAAKQQIRETMFRALQLPANTIVEYKRHAASIADSSSFFNTVVAPAGAGSVIN